MLSIFIIGKLSGLKVGAAGTVSGTVFQDFNGNGNFDTSGGTAAAPTAIDVGIGGITVTAYDGTGATQGSAVTAAAGTYSFSTGGAGPYRLEFTTLPAGFQPSARSTDSVAGGTAINSGSTVQFVLDGTTANVNLAVNRPEEFCQNNPTLLTCRFNSGAQNGAFGTNPVLEDFLYNDGTVYTDTTIPNYDNPLTHTISVPASSVGSIYGLAYSRLNKRVYASSFYKRYVGFGSGVDTIYNTPPTSSDDPGAIYVVNPATNAVVNRFTVAGATTNSHSDAAASDTTAATWDAVGKTSLGGIALADDESSLFVMNLQNKTLYALNPTTGASTDSQVVPIPATCPAVDVRPFAVKYYRGNVYVGMVCSAESTQSAANLRAYVYQVDPLTLTFGTTPYTFSLNYNRGFNEPAQNGGATTFPDEWRPWTPTIQNTLVYPQPLLADIDFDNGNLILGFRDRLGDQGVDAGAAAGFRPAGDVLRSCGSFTAASFPGTLTLEANGRCGGAGTAPQNTGQGPGAAPGTAAGSGEFYFQDDFSNPANSVNYHDEVSSGGLLKLPGYTQTVATFFDPISRVVGPNETFDGGFRWLNNTTGGSDRAYRLFNGDGLTSTGGEFGKVNGLGDIISLCNSAPIEIGNRVWRDANNNGVQDPSESRAGSDAVSLAGITVRLYNSTNVLVGTAVTNLDGEYYFTSGTAADPDITDNIGIVNGGILPNTAYQIRFDNVANFAVGGVLAGLVPTRANAAQQAGNTAATDSDALRVTNPVNSPTTGVFPVISYTTGAAGSNNHTLDAGFASPVSIGSTVFNDVNDNGLFDTGETGIGGVSVELLYDANNDGVINGAELTTPLLTMTTSSVAGSIGNYFFGGLTPGNYQVRIPTPPATATVSSTVTTTTDNRIDNDDNGIQSGGAGGSTISPLINLTPGAEPLNAVETGQGGTQDDTAPNIDANGDMTVDFGFTQSYSIGNRAWFDTNNDGQINAGEAGISGASVSVFASTNLTTALATMTTDTLGYYRFDNLTAGTYVVRINPSNFANAGVLGGYQNTTGNTAADLDSTMTAGQNGEDGINPTGAANTIQTNGISSSVVTLGGLAEPTGETDVQASGQGTADNQANMTIDFGFYRMNLSGTVWSDNGAGGTAVNVNNGILDGTEAGIIGVRVQLYDSANVEIPVGPDGILGTSDDAAGGMLTNSSGDYNFQGLPPGNYRVVTTPSGATSSVPTQINPNDNVDNDDNGFPNTTEGFTGKIISGLITLTPAGEVSSSNASGATFNPTVDFGYILAATVVQLDKFDAFTDGAIVELQWSTGSEANNLGFNIYREVNGKRHLLNAAPIAGNALRSGVQLQASGGDYSWTDKEAVPNAVYYLEDLDLDGSTNLHGAATPQFRQTLDQQPNARTFSDLANVASPAGFREIVAGGNQKSAVLTDRAAAAAMAQQQQIAALGGAKITIKHDGWYRVTAGQLQAAGFDTNSNPKTWQLYADGAEVPFKLNSDSIEFFGRGTNTPLTDKQIYYLIKGRRNGLRVNASDGGAAGKNADAQSFGVTVERRDRAIYVAALLNGDEDNWFGAVVSRSNETVQNLNAVNVDSGEGSHLSLKLQGVTAVEHQVSVRFNDAELGIVEFSGFENKQFEFDLPASAVREGANSVRLQSNGAGSDASLVDTIRLGYRRGYTASDNRIRFSVPANQSVRVNGFTAADISVYEIRGGAARAQIVVGIESSPGGDGFSLGAASADREMIAVVNATVEQASAVEANTPSTWHNSDNQADFVIVTAGELRESADTLAAMREAQGLKTKVVLVDDLFDEFTFGRCDPNAVKQFLKTAATQWRTKPNYALLFGDSSYDPRNNLGLTTTRDLVPTKLVDTIYMETASDSWLADFDNDGAEDLALGRLPVGNAAEAAAAVEKLARFDRQKARQAKTDVLVADDGFENYSADLQSLLPRNVISFRIDRSAGGDAETHQRIIERLNDNPLLVTYTGHGSAAVWASSGIFGINDAAELTNRELSVYLLMNCLNGYTHQPTGSSLAEALFKSPNGAIAIWASSGITEAGNQAAISRSFTDLVFNTGNSKTLRIGDVVKAAKRASDDSDVRRTWQLIGDPTIFVK